MKLLKLYGPLQGIADNMGNLFANEVITDAVKPEKIFQLDTTSKLIQYVEDAAELVRTSGEAAFNEFRFPRSRWQNDDTYIFVLDPEGKMVVHPDPELEGKNQLDLQDINGKYIIQGLIRAATALPDKLSGWYHYQWPVPGGLLPRWKSSYVRLVKAPSGNNYIVGCGIYNDRMEKEFVVDVVKDAVGQIEKDDKTAFQHFHDPKGPFMVKDAYIFVIDENGIDLVNPAFPNLEGRNILDLKDTHGKQLVREMIKVAKETGSGWVDYMWPKPGQSVSTQKSTYVSKAKIGDKWILVGCGVYLADAPKAISTTQKMTATELMNLVREGATVFEKQGEKAFPEFRKKGSKWFHDDIYFYVLTMDGTQIFHAADPSREGRNENATRDVLGRAFGKMQIEAARSISGEGWAHYMWPEPGDIFPKWKSTFVKRVTFPSGKQYFIGSGIYNMQMDKAFIEDVVNRAADLVAERGDKAFDLLRDKTGPYVFMDTYVFVDNLAGVELVNPAQPGLEGKNIINEKDLNGKFLVRSYIDAAIKNGSAWIDYYWYRPGENTSTQKYTYVRKVTFRGETYIVGSGLYVEDHNDVAEIIWNEIKKVNSATITSTQ